MTLQALRNRVGDPAFFQLMRQWALTHRGGNGSVRQFIALAQRLTGQDLQAFFQVWLYTGSKPAATADNGLAGVRPARATTGSPGSGESHGSALPAPASVVKMQAAQGLRR